MKAKAVWKQATKGYVARTYGQKECANCSGKGYVGDEPDLSMCSCATLAFRRAAKELFASGRLRERIQRIGNRDAQIIEYREIGSV